VKGNFITIVYGILDCDKGTFTFSRAGHNPVMHYSKAENKVHMLQPSGVGIGMTDNTTFSKYLKSDTITFGKGDVILLFTDGIVEALSTKRTYYGDDRLISLLQNSSDLSSDEILNKIISDVEEFCTGERQQDDMTLVVLKMP
jgi:serine phosphatase RsbU (regulator of sigma subunit)